MKNDDLITKEEIKQIFARKIRPRLNALNEQRKAVKMKLLLVMGGTLILLSVAYALIPQMSFKLFFMLTFGLLSIEYTMLTKKFVENFKDEVISEIFSALIPGCHYESIGSVDEEDFIKSHFINDRMDEYYGEDYVKGIIGNMKVEFAETRVTKRVKSSKGGSRDQTLFSGLFFKFELNKNLNQKTLILADHSENFFGKQITRFFQKKTARSDYELVQVESTDFEKIFAVYSNDQVKSRVLLKPRVLENLIAFKHKYKQDIEISICDSILYVAIHTNKNQFEPNMFGEIVSMLDIREIYDLVKLIHDLQDDLELPMVA